MMVLTVLACILLLLLLLLLIPVRLHVSLTSGSWDARLCLLCFRLRLLPDGEKARKKVKKRKKKPARGSKKKQKPEKEKQKPTFSETLQTARDLLPAAGGALNLLRRNLVLYRVRVHLALSRPDAHETALFYARVTAFAGILVSLLDSLLVLHPPEMYVFPDFTHDKSRYDISFRVRIQPMVVLIALIQGAAAALRHGIPGRRRSPGRKTAKKGGNVHESATTASHQ